MVAKVLLSVESYVLYEKQISAHMFSREVAGPLPVSRNLADTLSPTFIDEFGPAINKKIAGFSTHKCFEAVPLQNGDGCLPTERLFTRDLLPKPGWSCVGITKF